MEITNELLQTIHRRAMQYCFTKFGKEPDELHIIGDSFTAVYGDSCRGEYYEINEHFGVECLSIDLDIVSAERKRSEEEQRLKRDEENRKQDKERVLREQEERRQWYLKLKKEFEF